MVWWAFWRPTDHGVEGEFLDPLLVVGQRSPTERHRGVEGGQAGPEQGSKGERRGGTTVEGLRCYED